MDERVVSVAVPLPFQAPVHATALPAGVPLPERGVRVVVPFGGRRVIGVVLGPPTTERQGAASSRTCCRSSTRRRSRTRRSWTSRRGSRTTTWRRPASATGSCFLPRACARAAPSSGSLKPGACRRSAARAAAAGPLRLSTLARRLGPRSTGAAAAPAQRGRRLRRAGPRRARLPRACRWRCWRRSGPSPRGKAQAEVVERLRAAGGRARVADLVRDRPSLRGRHRAARREGRLAPRGGARAARARGPARAGRRRGRRRPTDQERALADAARGCVEGGGFRPFLLHGVTGSGKTEVYFRAVETALARGRGAILLVPEIAPDADAGARRARRASAARCRVLHSELSAGERHDEWWRIREGEARVVVGARSAVFAPMPDLGPDRGRRGARRRLQAGREPALPRPRRGRDAGAARGLPGGARLGDALGRVATRTRAAASTASCALPRRIRPRGCRGSRSWTAARCCGPAASRS